MKEPSKCLVGNFCRLCKIDLVRKRCSSLDSSESVRAGLVVLRSDSALSDPGGIPSVGLGVRCTFELKVPVRLTVSKKKK